MEKVFTVPGFHYNLLILHLETYLIHDIHVMVNVPEIMATITITIFCLLSISFNINLSEISVFMGFIRGKGVGEKKEEKSGVFFLS